MEITFKAKNINELANDMYQFLNNLKGINLLPEAAVKEAIENAKKEDNENGNDQSGSAGKGQV